MKLLLYCNKAKPNIVKGIDNKFYISNAFKEEGIDDYKLNGKIVAECDFEVEEIIYCAGIYETTGEILDYELLKDSCLDSIYDLHRYLGIGEDGQKMGYAIHIKNLHIFDEPRDLSYYYTYGKEGWKRIEKAPQNMMYAYELLNFSDWRKNSRQYFYRNAVISIQPQWMCLILNHIKDVEVRKVVLKGMLS